MNRSILWSWVLLVVLLGLMAPGFAQVGKTPAAPAASALPSPPATASPEAAPAAPLVRQAVYRIKLDGVVLSPMAAYIQRGIKQAEEADAICLIQLDTPGGLVDVTDDIIKAMSNASVPTVVYVAPDGATAWSAGTYVAMAASVIAMSPKTTIGSAHPIITGQERRFRELENQNPQKGNITPAGKKTQVPGGPATGTPGEDQADQNPLGKFLPHPASQEETIGMEKATNALVAMIRALAEEHGRNADWAEKAVRESINATAREALKLHVIEIVAADTPDLLRQLDGRKVKVRGKEVILHPRTGEPVDVSMNRNEKLLYTVMSHPAVAIWLLFIATMGIIYELKAPGSIIPGVAGGICLILGLYSVGQLPINWAGLSLILLGLVFFITELKIHTFGALTLGGIIAVTLGAMMLVPSDYPYLAVSKWSAISMGLTLGLFFGVVLAMIVRSYHRKVTTGQEALLGSVAEVRSELVPGEFKGLVFLMGELWKARPAGDQPIPKGARVRVVELEGLRVIVEPQEDSQGT